MKINRRTALIILEQYEILNIIALGEPKKQIVLEEIDLDGDIKYWCDENAVHHVPKRRLEDIIVQ